jgi:hypothetical protein
LLPVIVDQSKFSWWIGEMPSVSIQEALLLPEPTLTEAANGTTPNCTGLAICFICSPSAAIVVTSCLAASLSRTRRFFPEPVPV